MTGTAFRYSLTTNKGRIFSRRLCLQNLEWSESTRPPPASQCSQPQAAAARSPSAPRVSPAPPGPVQSVRLLQRPVCRVVHPQRSPRLPWVLTARMA